MRIRVLECHPPADTKHGWVLSQGEERNVRELKVDASGGRVSVSCTPIGMEDQDIHPYTGPDQSVSKERIRILLTKSLPVHWVIRSVSLRVQKKKEPRKSFLL